MVTPPPAAASRPPATPAMNDARANAHSLYSDGVDAGGDGGRLALAERGPGPPGLAPDVPQRRAGTSARRRRRSSGSRPVSLCASDGRGSRGRGAARRPSCRRSRSPPFGNCVVRSTTVIAPAAISVISARYRPDRRSAGSPMSVPSSAGDEAGDQDQHGERERGGVVEPQRHPGADGQRARTGTARPFRPGRSAGRGRASRCCRSPPRSRPASRSCRAAPAARTMHEDQRARRRRAPHRVARAASSAGGGGRLAGACDLRHVVERPHLRVTVRSARPAAGEPAGGPGWPARTASACGSRRAAVADVDIGEGREARLHDADDEPGGERHPQRAAAGRSAPPPAPG